MKSLRTIKTKNVEVVRAPVRDRKIRHCGQPPMRHCGQPPARR